MAELTSEIVDDVVAACKAGADKVAEALSRALDAKVTVSVGQPGPLDTNALPEELSGAGLAAVLVVDSKAALVLLPEASGLVPKWCADPDPTGQSRLATLAQELGMLVLPERLTPKDFKAGRVKNLAGALRRGGVGESATMVPLELADQQGKHLAWVVWPAAKPAAVIGSAKPKPDAGPKVKPRPTGQQPPAQPKPQDARLRDLPNYTRSLLRIKVPVVVTLAEKRQPLGRIVELGPGSIIQFDKSCEEMLEMDVGERPVATGEAVKVGDKFGLRITSIVLPEERFKSVRARPHKK